jgi:hypothetical protein
MKTKFISIILLGASLGLGSCSDYLDTDGQSIR